MESSGVRLRADARYVALMHRLDAAERRCARRKRGRQDAIAFRATRLEGLHGLCAALLAEAWKPSPGSVFVTTRPKHREIHAARYADRVVHHLILDALGPELDRRLSPASFACRKGKGTLAAVLALQAWMRRLTRHGGRAVWALKLDVRSFFHSIDRELVWRQLQAPLRAVAAQGGVPFDLPGVVRAVLDDAPALTARRVGRPSLFERVPVHKRLGEQAEGTGLPIGNLTSQWFANVALDPLDHFVQRHLGVSAYVRYMDDFILLDPDPSRLSRAEAAIRDFVRTRLGLELHPAAPLRRVSAGIDFCGAVVRPDYLLPRRRSTGAWHDRLRRAARSLVPRVRTDADRPLRLIGFGAVRAPAAAWLLAQAPLDAARSQWASGLGVLRMGGGRTLLARAWRRHPWLARCFSRDATGRLRSRYAPLGTGRLGAPAPPRAPTWKIQRRALIAAAGAAIVLVQWGPRLRLLRRRDAARLGVAPGRGLPSCGRGRAGPWLDRALAAGHSVLLVAQGQRDGSGVAPRWPAWLLEPLARAERWWGRWVGVASPGSVAAVAPPQPRRRRPSVSLRRKRRRRSRRARAVVISQTAPCVDAWGQVLLPWG